MEPVEWISYRDFSSDLGWEIEKMILETRRDSECVEGTYLSYVE